MTTDPDLNDTPETPLVGYDPEAWDKAWAAYFADAINGWPPNYAEDERKAIEEFGGG